MPLVHNSHYLRMAEILTVVFYVVHSGDKCRSCGSTSAVSWTCRNGPFRCNCSRKVYVASIVFCTMVIAVGISFLSREWRLNLPPGPPAITMVNGKPNPLKIGSCTCMRLPACHIYISPWPLVTAHETSFIRDFFTVSRQAEVFNAHIPPQNGKGHAPLEVCGHCRSTAFQSHLPALPMHLPSSGNQLAIY